MYYTIPYHTFLYSTILYEIPYEYYNNTILMLYLLCDVQAKLEGARGALLRHEKVTAEQA